MIGDGDGDENQQMRDQRTSRARRHTDAAEAWLRRIVDYQFTAEFGREYFSSCPPINNGVRSQIQRRMAGASGRFPKMIDATTFDEIIDIITNPNTYGKCFAQVFNEVYPIGREQLRCSLGRLGSIRNHLAHGRACTSRQMEQAICYSNDLVDCIKRYFGSINMSKVYNVPTIIRFCDNMGNEHNLDGISENISSRIIDWRILGRGDLIPGEQLVAEVEIDPSFDAGDYHVKWYALSGKVWGDYMGTTALINIGIEHVGEQFELRFSVTTNRGWHRFSNCDDSLCLIYRVLPPP